MDFRDKKVQLAIGIIAGIIIAGILLALLQLANQIF